jgi:hypothetical protein
MDMGIGPAGRCQDVVVVRGVGYLGADVDLLAVNRHNRGSAHKAVDERRVGVLENLLDWAAKLVGWLRPIVVLHRYNDNFLDFLCAGGTATHGDKHK